MLYVFALIEIIKIQAAVTKQFKALISFHFLSKPCICTIFGQALMAAIISAS